MSTKQINKRLIIFVVFLLSVMLAACSGKEPKQIAIYPRSTPVALPPGMTFVYSGYQELKVWDVDRTAEEAAQLAYNYGGYLYSSQSWYSDNHKATTLQLAVPTANFDSLLNALHNLGELVSENVSGEWVDQSYNGYPQQYSTITLQLRSGSLSLPEPETPGWNPLRTLQKAFGVFVTIFGFLADILIWVLVVGGPFVLVGLGIGWIVKRSRK